VRQRWQKQKLADVQAQQALLAESLTELKQAALLLSAPEGIAQVTPEVSSCRPGKTLSALLASMRISAC
jgi:type VI secretion system secreted protein VgrG